MNYIRTLVSGKKKRFIDRKFNLDLSYVTPRILAMAYPASGIETVYRNDIDSVIFHNLGFKISKR
jgi:phosphatidylinositol-3,4,5-trisphosphate 3-phosphatase/dual-specificity protein phosphatase PTEN